MIVVQLPIVRFQVLTTASTKFSLLDMRKALALAYNQLDKLKAENSSSNKCNCSSTHWTVVKDKLQSRNKRFCSYKDLKFNVKLSNKFEALTMSKPPGVSQLKTKEDEKLLANDNSNRKHDV
jgi:hypothetical protein